MFKLNDPYPKPVLGLNPYSAKESLFYSYNLSPFHLSLSSGDLELLWFLSSKWKPSTNSKTIKLQLSLLFFVLPIHYILNSCHLLSRFTNSLPPPCHQKPLSLIPTAFQRPLLRKPPWSAEGRQGLLKLEPAVEMAGES